MYYQDINEILAKGIKIESMSSDYVKEISDANAYLLKRIGNKPLWLDDFLNSNRCKLVETICRATSQGIGSLQGYSEGYFNEIIQNANDLYYGDVIRIKASKSQENCKLDCEYADKGFELSNIYAFLNREMSDKTDDESQTGKFGVGIKSFFKFVDRLSIQSNVIFDFSIDRTEVENNISGTTLINTDWDETKTTLSINYKSNLESEFNTDKLTELIKYLCGESSFDILRCFLTGSDSELVFDIRSLIFMQLNSKTKKNISKMEFIGKAHCINVTCSEENKIQVVSMGDEIWKIGVIRLKLDVDHTTKYEKDYIVFSHNSISVAFPVAEFSIQRNRMYSTYYLKEDRKEQILPIGMLVDSKYANIHRNDVGDSEEKINSVYERLRDYIRSLYGFMCSEEVASLSCAEAVSDVFHNIIARYLMVDRQEYRETPLSEAYFTNAFLPKKSKEVAKTYIIKHKDKEGYDSASYQEGDIVQELRENYFEFVERKDTYDLRALINDSNCIYGVRKVYSLLQEQNSKIPSENLNAAVQITNYFSTVKDFLVYTIAHERRIKAFVSDAEIDNWLLSLKDEVGKYFDAKMFLKLIGRYHLNNAIAYDGSILDTKLSFKDYLFNEVLTSNNGLLSQYQNQYYDEKYYNLKQELLQKRYKDLGNKKNPYMIRCIKPCKKSIIGWNGTYDYYEMISSQNTYAKLSAPQLLLERMATDDKFNGLRLCGNELRLFESEDRDMWKRDYKFKNFIIQEQQIIQLSSIKNIQFKSFVDFINAIKCRNLLSEELKQYIHICCKEELISTRNIVREILPIMVETPEGEKDKYLLDEFRPSDIEILNIQENSNNEMPKKNAEFVYKITGYHVHIYRFISNTRRKIIAYFGNGKCAIKNDTLKKYIEVAKYNSLDKNIYIFYDNISNNLQQTVNSVLNDIGVEKNLELLDGYIHNGNMTKNMSYISRRRNLGKVKRKLVLEWVDLKSSGLAPIYDTEILYRLLTARGSYDIFCPICADIPLETFDYGEDTKKKHSRKIILMENENPETNQDVPYIITVGCSYCCQRLRSTLIKSEFDGKNIILTTQISHGLHEISKSKQQIELSPVNIEVMKKFRIIRY